MSKKKRLIKKMWTYVLSLVLLAGILPQYVTPLKVEAAAAVKNINLNDGGEIAGISDPGEPTSTSDVWGGNAGGSYVYFGNYYQSNATDKKPIKWRVLDAQNDSDDSDGNNDGDSLLLLSDQVLDQVVFDFGTNVWSNSNIRKWLNSMDSYTTDGFLKTAFNSNEQTAINDTTKNDGNIVGSFPDELNAPELTGEQIFLLSAEEANTLEYGFYPVSGMYTGNNTTKLSATTYATNKGISLSGGYAYWWLRSASSNLSINAGVVSSGGALGDGIVNNISIGVSPAFNLNLSSVLFTSASGASKSTSFVTTTDESNTNTWNLTLSGGRDFTAERKSEETGVVVGPGGTITVDVSSVGTSDADNDVEYTQLSAMLVKDSDNTVVAYGKISDNVTTGEVEVTIPSSVAYGDYNLKVFAEDVNSSATENLTDYASNMAEIPLTVGDRKVEITKGSNMSLQSGSENQTGISDAMDNVVYEAKSGCYFPLNYGQDINGVTVARIDSNHISVSGWPTADTEIKLPDASDSIPQAVTSKKNINLGANVLTTTLDAKWNDSSGATVYFGQYGINPVLYRVLEADGTIALLDSDKILYAGVFNNDYLNANSNQRSGKPNEFNGSDLQEGLNSSEFYENTSVFTSTEKDAIVKSYLGGDSYTAGDYNFNYTDYPAYTYIFPLSAKEVVNYYGSTTKSGGNAYWWLRSAHTGYIDNAGVVSSGGALSLNDVDILDIGVSPAFNLDLTSVLFTSASGASKSSFAEVGDDKVSENTWKLTLSDGNTDFKASSSDTKLVVGEENQIRITGISGATAGANQISAALVNEAGEVLYYGNIADTTDTTATVTIPSDANLTAEGNYTLQIFAEQVNGDKETDYASNMVSISLKAEKQWTSISVKTPPTKENYIEGNTFNPAGLEITKHYSDGSEDTVRYADAKDNFSFDPSTSVKLKTTDNIITISYTEGNITKTTTLDITVSAKSLDSISVNKKPDITSYIVGEYFDPTGLELTLTYNNGDTEIVAYSESTDAEFSFAPDQFTGLNTSDEYVEIGYGGKIVNQDITVVEQVAKVVALPSGGTYESAQKVKLSTTTPEATIYFTTDGSEPTVNSTKYENIEISVNKSQTIKAIAIKSGMADSEVSTFAYIIKQDPKATDFICDLSDVTYDKTAKSLEVTAAEGKDLGTITVYYDGSPDAPVNAGTYAITVDVTGSDLWNSAAGISLGTWTIKQKPLTNVTAVIPAVKQDSALSLTNQTLALNSEDIETGDDVSGICDVTFPDTSAVGNFTTAKVTVNSLTNSNYSFTGELSSQSYTVTQKTLLSIEVTRKPNQTDYYEGDFFNPNGMVVTANYDSGAPVVLSGDAYSISPDEATELKATDSIITISYTEGDVTVTTTQSVSLTKKSLDTIRVKKVPDKTSYIVDETFDPTGLELTLTYNNKDTETIVYNDDTKDDFSFDPDLSAKLTTADTTVKISYGGKIVDQDITVLKQVEDVIADPQTGTYPAPQQVTLASKTDGVTIYYTTDGSEPNAGSEKYSGEISVDTSQTIKAIAIKSGMADSKVSSFKYVINPDPTAADLICDTSAVTYDKTAKTLMVSAVESKDLGTITVYYNGSTDAPVDAGTYDITADVSGSEEWSSVEGIALGTWTIEPKTLTDVSAVIPDVKQDSATSLTDQTLVLNSEDILTGDDVSGICDVIFPDTADAGSFITAEVTVKSLTNNNYSFTGTLNGQSYTVTAKILDRIAVTRVPDQTNYYEGDCFDPAGMEVTAYYDSGEPVLLSGDAYSILPDGTTELNTTDSTITISYVEGGITKTTTQTIKVIEKSLDTISVKKAPIKTSYIKGETFDPTGLELTLIYNNGNSETVVYNADTKDGFTFTPSLLTGLTAANKTVTITYGGKTAMLAITVLEQAAAVTANPLPGTYPQAQQVTLASKTDGVTIYYTTDGSEPTTSSTEHSDAIEVANTQTIKAIAVKQGMAESQVSTFAYIIKQDSTAEKLVYDLSAVTYNKNARELTVTARDGEDLGTITVKYNGSAIPPVNAGVYTITVDISESASHHSAANIELGTWEILPKTLTGVSAVIPDVKLDSALTLDNQTLELHSNTIEEGDSVSGTCQVTLGSTAAEGSYQDANVDVAGVDNPNYTFTGTLIEQSYTVTGKILTGIEITTPPDKNTYFAGEVFDKAGMVVTATYDSGDPVILENNEYSISPSGGLTSNDDKIMVSYGGKTAATSITVKLVELTSITIEKEPDKTEYVIGQSFRDIGMVVKAQYNNGAQQVISGYSYSPKDAMTTLGTQDITLSYTEGGITKEAIQQVKVIARDVSSIDVISQPFQRSYVEGQSLSLSGLAVSLTYNDGTSQEVSIDDFADLRITTSIADGTELSLSEHNGQTITITYEGISAETENLTVEAKAVTGLKIKNPPDKLSYTAGDALNLSGLTVTLIYNNGDTADVAFADFEASGITVNYKDGDILTSSANGSSILVTYKEISVSAGELSVISQLYQITVGAGSTYEIGSTTPILIICSGALNDLTGIYVDGVLLDPVNYTVTSGSTILTLNPDYLNGLSVGTHTLRLEYLYGSAETTFKVAEAKQTADTTKDTTKTTTTPASKTIAKTGTSAKTGDTASVMLWIALVVLSGMVISGSMWYRRKRR